MTGTNSPAINASLSDIRLLRPEPRPLLLSLVCSVLSMRSQVRQKGIGTRHRGPFSFDLIQVSGQGQGSGHTHCCSVMGRRGPSKVSWFSHSLGGALVLQHRRRSNCLDLQKRRKDVRKAGQPQAECCIYFIISLSMDSSISVSFMWSTV